LRRAMFQLAFDQAMLSISPTLSWHYPQWDRFTCPI